MKLFKICVQSFNLLFAQHYSCMCIHHAGETVAAFMSGMGHHAGSGGAATSSPSHGGGKGTIVLQDSPQLTTKVTQNWFSYGLNFCNFLANLDGF